MDAEDTLKKPYGYSKVESEVSRPTRTCIYIIGTAGFICLITCIVLAVLLSAEYKEYCPKGIHCSWHSTPPSEFLKDKRCDALCTTGPCLKSAHFALRRIDASKDPCQDFYEFACGTFENESILPQEDTEGIYTYQEMDTRMLINLKKIIDSVEDSPGKKGFSLRLTKVVYEDCMNTDDNKNTQTKDIWKKIFSENDILPPWPLVQKNASYDLKHAVKMMSSSLFYGANPFFSVLPPEKEFLNNVPRWNFRIRQPYIEDLKSIHKNTNADDQKNVYVRYQLLIGKILTDVGVNATDVANITTETVEFEKAFLKAATRAMKSTEFVYKKSEDLRYENHRHSCQVLDHRMKNMKWCRIFRQLLNDYGIAINRNVGITLPGIMDYFEEIDKLFSRFSNREIINYIALKFIMNHLKYMPSPLRNEYYEDQELFPRTNEVRKLSARWQQCVDIVSEFLWLPLEKEYLKKIFHAEKEAQVQFLVRKIKQAYLSAVDKMTWLKEAVSGRNPKAVIEKIVINIGSTDLLQLVDDSVVDRYFQKDFYMNPSSVEQSRNLLITDVLQLKALIRRVPLSPKKEIRLIEGISSFAVLSRFFAKGELNIRYGMLEFPMFLPGRPMYAEFATLGSFIFNYMTVHLLVNMAAKNSTMLGSLKSANCLEDKSQAMETGKTEFVANLPEDARMLFQFASSLATLGSFQAYKTYLKENGEEKGLPGLPFTNEQLFFLSNAQVQCEKFTGKGYANYPASLIIPARYRVNLPLANSKEFSKVFRCPSGSSMNPIRKCCVLGDGNLSHDCN